MTGTYYVNPNGLFDPLPGYHRARSRASRPGAPQRVSRTRTLFLAACRQDRQAQPAQPQQPVAPDEDGRRHEDRLRLQFRLQSRRLGQRETVIAWWRSSSARSNGKQRADQAQKMLTGHFRPLRSAQRAEACRASPMRRLGTLVPADLTGTVCRGKPLEIASARRSCRLGHFLRPL